MIRRPVIAVVALIGCALSARAQLGEIVQIRPSGEIVPTGVVATVSGVAAAAAAAASAAAQADIAADTAATVSGLLSNVTAIINGLEGVGYVKGYVLDFGSAGTEANTNVTSTIVKFVPGVSNDVTYAYADVYTYFSESPAEFPVCRWSTSAGRTNEWDEATSVSIALVPLLVGSTYYEEVYRNTVRVPVASASAFFRVFTEAVASQTGAFLPVQNGISPGSRTPLTGVFVSGTNTIHFVGGIRVQPN
jgi:hypothetical protein